MKVVTLLFLRDTKQERVLLAQKKRGFGVGKLNGTGGKVQEGESIEAAAVREAQEEINVSIPENALTRAGKILFYFDEHPDWDLECHVFITDAWEGEPMETEEMAPEWCTISQIPFERMWVDDQYWLHRALLGEYIDATFNFGADGEYIIRSHINGVGVSYVSE
jgi:8-oxo-dGTP diphosphatase